MRKFIFYWLLIPFAKIYAADTQLDPERLDLKVYKVAVSTSGNCSNPVTILTNDNPTYENFFDNPTIGAGTLANGSYLCVIIEFSDNIRVTPAETSTSGNCVAGTVFTIDVCRNGSSSTLIDGTTVNCAVADNRVAMYLSNWSSTSGSGSSNNSHSAFSAPTTNGDANNGLRLDGALVVSGGTTGTFVVNGEGQINDQHGDCDMNPPLFSFR